jgi:ring-1,2-phenylacetyl-CoA epoxidase subunit PaaD
VSGRVLTGATSPVREDLIARVRGIAARVPDPEIPVISIEDLGVLRDVGMDEDGGVQVTITPTYSGCPAMDEITADIRRELAAEGFSDVSVRLVLSPAWSTDMMTERGRQALLDFGIAPPGPRSPRGPVMVTLSMPSPSAPACPRCGAADTREISRFGSTACKALYRCTACLEPFDYFKAL